MRVLGGHIFMHPILDAFVVSAFSPLFVPLLFQTKSSTESHYNLREEKIQKMQSRIKPQEEKASFQEIKSPNSVVCFEAHPLYTFSLKLEFRWSD